MNSSILRLFFVLLCYLVLLTLRFGVCNCREIVCIPSERETLLKFKHHLSDPSNRLSSWNNNNSNSNCCHWHGVVCSNVTAHVLELHLNTSPPDIDDYAFDIEGYKEAYQRSEFGGEINPCLVDLKHLNYLDLSGNELLGAAMPIPTFLATMTSLTHLNLSHAGFNGNIPPEIGNLSNLVYLDLRYAANRTIPSQIGNLSNLLYLDLTSRWYEPLFAENVDWLSSLWKLQYLDLGGANLSKSFHWLHTLQALPSLMHLSLSSCTLPPHYYQPSLLNFSSLLTLDMSSAFNAPPVISFVPKWVFGLKKLASLTLSYNSIQGPIPGGIQNLTLLQNLDLSENSFSSSIPHWLYGLHHLNFLNLRGNNLHGNISDALGNLTSLLGLDLSHNHQLEGTIPSSLGNLTSLVRLDLSHNHQLEGTIPSSLGNLTSLVRLDLSDNKLEGTIPTSLGNLTSLVRLDLSYNQLEGPIPSSLGNLTSLVRLHLSYNQLEGPIPSSLGNLTSLVRLDLSANKLEGTIPTSLGNLTSLVRLDLSANKLEGTIPTSLGNLTSLVRLDLSFSQLEGPIPTSLGNLCNLKEIDFSYLKLNQQVNEILQILAPCISHRLTTLEVRGSHLSGNLTYQFGVFENIAELDFSSNSIGGALPRSLGELSSLKFLILSHNQFNGNPFESLRSLSKLSYLEIGDNHFQGIVKEDDLANLTSLDSLSASGSNLTLKVGPNWLPSFQLTSLEMSSWQLGPSFPSWIRSQNKLAYLDMSNTGILDSIPTWFWEAFPQADYLDLSQNHIHGELGTTLKTPISTNTVDLSTNNLSGKLPSLSNVVAWLDLSNNSFSESMNDFLCQRQDKPMRLEFLNLESNNLSGEIPDCWMIWPLLVDVNLQSNHFVGNLPPSMGSLAELQSLGIRNNSLSGIFPTVLKKTNKLISLDLGENKFSGTIPAWVAKSLLYVKILLLRSNRFLGHIPNEICDMSLLQVLDLAQNNLSGNIPTCFNRLNAMTLINKSIAPIIFFNSENLTPFDSPDILSVLLWLKGRGDEYRNFLGLVTSIDLSSNKLLGEIPREITDLNGLNFLNLSHNQLNGHIPPRIGNMGSLQSIDFSRNQLSGEIPSSISNLSFLSMLDLSYNHLKGKIPTGTQLQTFDAFNFIGNNLCGPPLPINCSSNGKIPSDDHNGKGSHRHGVNWFFVSMTFGFVVGFWTVIAPLLISRSWRYAYFHFLDDVWFKLQSLW